MIISLAQGLVVADRLCGDIKCCNECCRQVLDVEINSSVPVFFQHVICGERCFGVTDRCLLSESNAIGCAAAESFLSQDDVSIDISLDYYNPFDFSSRTTICCFATDTGDGDLRLEDQCVADSPSTAPTKLETESPTPSPNPSQQESTDALRVAHFIITVLILLVLLILVYFACRRANACDRQVKVDSQKKEDSNMVALH